MKQIFDSMTTMREQFITMLRVSFKSMRRFPAFRRDGLWLGELREPKAAPTRWQSERLGLDSRKLRRICLAKDKAKAPPTVDLHGHAVDEVFDIVDAFLRRHHSAPRVRIMTGKGKGLVRRKVEDYLRLGGFPFEAERLADGRRNEGVLVVFLQ
jgi:DNA-nicking Smr family endonuclease